MTKHYTANGRGTEALAVEWIVRHLKQGGNALVIVPDGLLIQKNMLSFIKNECVIRAVISLPTRTFYATPKKTYILSISRKYHSTDQQSEPVFTYLVSEIGESRDAKRFKINRNDLDEAIILYKQFKASPKYFTSTSTRCKIVTFDDFIAHEHWLVDRLWSDEEREELGIEDEKEIISEEEFWGIVGDAHKYLDSLIDGES